MWSSQSINKFDLQINRIIDVCNNFRCNLSCAPIIFLLPVASATHATLESASRRPWNFNKLHCESRISVIKTRFINWFDDFRHQVSKFLWNFKTRIHRNFNFNKKLRAYLILMNIFLIVLSVAKNNIILKYCMIFWNSVTVYILKRRSHCFKCSKK